MIKLKNNLISLTDKVFPGVNELFTSPEKSDGHQKWIDFTEEDDRSISEILEDMQAESDGIAQAVSLLKELLGGIEA